MNTTRSSELFHEAQKHIPGGVNSPVRAFKSVGRDPLFIDHAKGAKIYDADGNEFIDYVGSWGPMIVGHAHESVECIHGLALLARQHLEGVVEIARRGPVQRQ